jgi:hypothetical protein
VIIRLVGPWLAVMQDDTTDVYPAQRVMGIYGLRSLQGPEPEAIDVRVG